MKGFMALWSVCRGLAVARPRSAQDMFNTRAAAMIRYGLVTLLLCLTGCDEPESKPAPKPATVAAPVPVLVPVAVPAPVAPASAPPVAASVAPPKPAQKSPITVIKSAPALPVKLPAKAIKQPVVADRLPAKPAVKAPSKSVATSPVTRQKLPRVPLDLSLPHELVNQLEHGQPIPDVVPKARLLPPLFVEKPAGPSAFQLSGKLITNDLDREKVESDNFLDRIDGAQLNFEFRK